MRVLSLAALCLSLVIAPAALAQETQEAQQAHPLKSHPGYIDLAAKEIFPGLRPAAEIVLETPVLKMMAGAVKESEPELAELVGNLKLVRIQHFAVTEEEVDGVSGRVEELCEKLSANGWSRAAYVSEKREGFGLYLKNDGDKLAGLCVLGYGSKDTGGKHGEAAFVNVVGRLDYEQVGKLAGKFFKDMAGRHGGMDFDFDMDMDDDEGKNDARAKKDDKDDQ